jgi:L-ascorbate metabolism protein UlaG (beta-lactamase superfamily)
VTTRKTRFIDCNPRWRKHVVGDHAHDVVEFDCPEGHEACSFAIPLTPWHVNGWDWNHLGFEHLSLGSSVKSFGEYESVDEAVADGRIREHVHRRMWCHAHVNITNGEITFAGDSK